MAMIDLDCIETFEAVEGSLKALEEVLAKRLALPPPYRESLIKLDQANLLVEDELVADWHGLLASWHRWKREQAHE